MGLRNQIISKCWTILLFLLMLTPAPFNAFASKGTRGSWLPMPLTTLEQKEAGVEGGEGFQKVMAIVYSPSNPQIVYLSSSF